MIYAAVILAAVILFYAWMVLAARFQEDREFRVGDWVRINDPALSGIDGHTGKIVFVHDHSVVIELRGKPGIPCVYGQHQAKKHLKLLEAV